MDDRYKNEVIDPGDEASKIAAEVNKRSFNNNPAIRMVQHNIGTFRGPVGMNFSESILRMMISGQMAIESEADGMGGKPDFFSFVGTEQIFEDLFSEIPAMCADDFARTNRYPAILATQIDIKKVTKENFNLIKAIYHGAEAILKKLGLISWTGETAIMKNKITGFCDLDDPKQLIVSWNGFCIGISYTPFLITGQTIKPGMAVIGFGEHGYRCNGGTWLADVLMYCFGPAIEKVIRDENAIRLAKKLSVPSTIYFPTINRLGGWNSDGTPGNQMIKIHGAANITGGGIWGKAKEMLPPGMGLDLDTMIKPPEVLLEMQELSWGNKHQLSDWRAHSTLHGGPGFIVIVDKNDAETVIAEAKKDKITAQVIGSVINREDQEITIFSQFKQGKTLSSNHPE